MKVLVINLQRSGITQCYVLSNMLHMNTAVDTLQMPLVISQGYLKIQITLACMYINMSVCLCRKLHFFTTRGKILLRPVGHNSDNEIFSPIINSVYPPNLCKWKKQKTKRVAVMVSLPRWTPEDSAVQNFFALIVLKFLVCFSQPLIGYILVAFPHLLVRFTHFHRLKND